ncbi:hypothetical protein ASD24_02710 [Paenibacillus sp. Root52]|uniref:Uncharacterized protein n=1 Tax=Paenibacillus amylolyticus TaxID=1451 RepID=A0AAP5H174_PAEAM|nr:MULTISPECIES: hypothetical protein [Paenibacillus]KQY94485.1 hypothetical protein ASD24_02710 [Paenibacillus sp. Root52]MDR6724433.1 hypothetical protein [Paenibacillus amylolyticus]
MKKRINVITCGLQLTGGQLGSLQNCYRSFFYIPLGILDSKVIWHLLGVDGFDLIPIGGMYPAILDYDIVDAKNTKLACAKSKAALRENIHETA